MSRIPIAVCLTLAWASVARAGFYIELVPGNPGTQGPLLYAPGESLLVDIIIHNQFSDAKDLRLIQWDVSASDPAITFNDEFAFNLPFGGALYSVFPDYPIPAAAYTSTGPPGFMFSVPGDGSALSGMMSITLPLEEGAYKLDVINYGTLNPNEGAVLAFGFGGVGDPVVSCSAGDFGFPCLEGGSLLLNVVPEPATLWLVALGTYGLLRRGFVSR